MLIIQTNFIIITITVAAIVYLVQQQNRQHGFCQEGSGYIPANFQAKKSHINGLGTVFSGTFNGDEDIKTICQSSYSLNLSTADLFLFQRCKVEAGRPLAVQGGLMTNFDRVARISSKNKSAAAFWR